MLQLWDAWNLLRKIALGLISCPWDGAGLEFFQTALFDELPGTSHPHLSNQSSEAKALACPGDTELWGRIPSIPRSGRPCMCRFPWKPRRCSHCDGNSWKIQHIHVFTVIILVTHEHMHVQVLSTCACSDHLNLKFDSVWHEFILSTSGKYINEWGRHSTQPECWVRGSGKPVGTVMTHGWTQNLRTKTSEPSAPLPARRPDTDAQTVAPTGTQALSTSWIVRVWI